MYLNVLAEAGHQQLAVQHRQRIQERFQPAFPQVVKPLQQSGAAQVLLVPAVQIQHGAILLGVRQGKQQGPRFGRFLQQYRVLDRRQGLNRSLGFRVGQQVLDALLDFNGGEARPKRLGDKGALVTLIR